MRNRLAVRLVISWADARAAALASGWKRNGRQVEGPCPFCGGRCRAHLQPGDSVAVLGSCRECERNGIEIARALGAHDPSGGQTIIEKLEHYQKDVAFGVVLATPDDQEHPRNRPDETAYRVRQNVVLKLGMLLASPSLGRRRVAILMKNQDGMERPSDIQGLIYIPFRDDVAEAGTLLAKELNAQGVPIDVNRL